MNISYILCIEMVYNFRILNNSKYMILTIKTL